MWRRAALAVVFYYLGSTVSIGDAHHGKWLNGIGFNPTNIAGDFTVESSDHFPSIKTGSGFSDHWPIIATFAFWNDFTRSITAPSVPRFGNSYAVTPTIETAALNLSGNIGCPPSVEVNINLTSTSASLSAAAIEYAYHCASTSESAYRYKVFTRPFISPAMEDICALERGEI